MKVFDLAKNMQAGGFRHIVVGDEVCQLLRENTEESEGECDPLLGFSVHVVADHQDRKIQAVWLSSITGREVVFEGEDGEWLIASMPKADSLFPQTPFKFKDV